MKRKIFNAIAIISTLAMLCWLATAFLGGMYIYFLNYSVLIITIIIFYNVSFVDTFVSIIRRGVRRNMLKVSLHAFVILTLWTIILFQSDVFKSKRIITATLKVDPYLYTVIFRANGICESEAFSMFGYKEFKRGTYKFCGDTIVFKKKPSDIPFIPDTLLLDKKLQAIYYDKNQLGEFSKEMDWPDHFEVR